MKFRTTIESVSSEKMVDYNSSLFFIGSCFSEEIGFRLAGGKLNITINPFGVLYNPLSIADAITLMAEDRRFEREDIYQYDGRYISFNHDTSFSSPSLSKSLKLINNSLVQASFNIRSADFLFITFGTARVFRLKETGRIVSNCHKLPSAMFNLELLSVNEIVDRWKNLIDKIRNINREIQIVFTVSPVRHWKDGAHGNQVSKSLLFVALEELLSSDRRLSYYQSYELMMDDLRDYRFYNRDMLHPSDQAIDYILDHFIACYFEDRTRETFNEISRITRSVTHRVIGDNPNELKTFKFRMLDRIKAVSKIHPHLNFSLEREYFEKLS